MKVNITQVEDVKIGKFKWWSNWIDIAIYNHGRTGNLLQMKVNRINGKKFKSTKLSGSWFDEVDGRDVGDLTSMKGNN